MEFRDFHNYLQNMNKISAFDNKKSSAKSVSDATDAPNQSLMQTAIMNKILVINSKDRNIERFPNQSKFQVSNTIFERNIKNIRNIQLEDCIVPNFSLEHPYLILKIPELQDVIQGTNNDLRTCFAILIPERVHGDYVTCKRPTLICQKQFDPPLAQLTSISIEFLTPNGEEYVFPDDKETLTILNICFEIPNKNSVFGYEIIT